MSMSNDLVLDSPPSSWVLLRYWLEKGCRVTYLDTEGDEIPIESECEYREYLKFYKNNHDPDYPIKNCDEPKANYWLKNLQRIKMAPKELHSASSTSSVSDSTEYGINATQSQLRYNGMQNEISGDTAPKWFTTYMEKMKKELVTEISERVTTIVMDALIKKRENHSESANWHPQVPDSGYLLDSDSEERMSVPDPEPSTFWSGGHRYKFNRRGHRFTQENPRNERSNNPSSSYERNRMEILHFPEFHPVRSEMPAINKREYTLPIPSGRSGGFDNMSALYQNIRTVRRTKLVPVVPEELLDEEAKLSNRQTLPCEMKRSSSMPTISEDTLQEPALQSNGTEEKVRMGCSVTGQDLLKGSNDSVHVYCNLSDSDNISIVSDVSVHEEELQWGNGFFEMVSHSSPIFAYQVEHDLPRVTSMNLERHPQEPEDLENTRDSSSFELVSEPPASPSLSINMDEYHLANPTDETSNYNINDETTTDKCGNESKIDNRPYATDAHGRIYQQNIMDGAEECPEIVLEKRSGGAYSFVGETLPVVTKNDGLTLSKEADLPHGSTAPTRIDDRWTAAARAASFDDLFLSDSTQSFHSHTAQQPENDRNGSSAAAAASQPEEASGSHVFTDHNASKGLGDTKQSSPNKESSSGDKSSEYSSCRSERTRPNSRRSSQDSRGSADRNNGSRDDPRCRRFTNWSTTCSTRMMDDVVFSTVDPMHILPESLVSGAVHVASSAYTTARRVYDKILTVQMRNRPDRSQSRFGRR